eukprot:4722886-Ditylum_brightwellii.AAC.1
MKYIALLLLAVCNTHAFVTPNASPTFTRTVLYSEATAEETTAAAATSASEVVTIDPKEAVKIFGRLAEKYIMLDSSGGMCCYSACT